MHSELLCQIVDEFKLEKWMLVSRVYDFSDYKYKI